MDLILERGDENSAPLELLQFVVKVIEFREKAMDLKIEFENPDMVSKGYYADTIEVQFKNNDFFAGFDDYSEIEDNDE